MLTPTSRAKERILLFGKEGTGKTNAWCTIAAWMRRTNSPGKVYVVDTDLAVDRMADSYGDAFFENVVAGDANEWEDYTKLVNNYHSLGTNDDWLVVDLIDKAWEAVQNYYVEQTSGKDPAAYFLEYRKEKEEGHPLAGAYGSNWTVINKLYSQWMGKVIRFPGHVLLCTPGEPIQQPNKDGSGGDSKDVLETYGRVAYKPKGQKGLGFQVHTVGLMATKGEGWVMTTVKDRSRERMKGAVVNDFVDDYLVKVGGWKKEL